MTNHEALQYIQGYRSVILGLEALPDEAISEELIDAVFDRLQKPHSNRQNKILRNLIVRATDPTPAQLADSPPGRYRTLDPIVPAKNHGVTGNRKARLTAKAQARREEKRVKLTKLSEADLKAFLEMPQQLASACMMATKAFEAVTGRAVDSLREIDDVA